MMQTFEVDGLQVARPVLEAMIESKLEAGDLDQADRLIAMLDANDSDPDMEPSLGYCPFGSDELEWDARNGDMPPVDPLTGADIVQDLDWHYEQMAAAATS
jgi:hypothetical protein